MGALPKEVSEAITTASWRVTVAQKLWVEREARRRAKGGDGNQSEVVREALDLAMRQTEEPETDPAAADVA